MKKIGLLSLVIIFLINALPAAADVVWTPVDEFLSKCDYLKVTRSYIAAGETGWVEGIDLPSDPSKVRKFPNGTEFPVSAVCGKGEDRWAVIETYRNPWEGDYLWPDLCFIPMKDLVLGYDAAVFEEMHRDELRPFKEDFDFCAQETLEVRLTPDSAFVLYETAPRKLYGCREVQDFRNYYGIDSVYVDENGDHWVPIKNVFARQDGWVNISR